MNDPVRPSVIESHADRRGGAPCLRGTQISVSQLLLALTGDLTMSLLSTDYEVPEQDLVDMLQEIARDYEVPRLSLKDQALKLSELDLANVENRLAASRSSPNYNDRNHCDVPGHVLQRMIDYIRATGGIRP